MRLFFLPFIFSSQLAYLFYSLFSTGCYCLVLEIFTNNREQKNIFMSCEMNFYEIHLDLTLISWAWYPMSERKRKLGNFSRQQERSELSELDRINDVEWLVNFLKYVFQMFKTVPKNKIHKTFGQTKSFEIHSSLFPEEKSTVKGKISGLNWIFFALRYIFSCIHASP